MAGTPGASGGSNADRPLLSLAHSRADPGVRPHRRHRASLTAASYRYFVRGQGAHAAAADHVIAAKRHAALSRFDRLLRRFRYRQALDVALDTRRPEVRLLAWGDAWLVALPRLSASPPAPQVVSSVVEELASRGGLGTALAGRDPDSLRPLLAHIRRYLVDPRHALLLSSLAHRVLDAYSELVSANPALVSQLEQLLERVRKELQAQEDLLRIRGMLEPLMASGLAGR